MNGLAGPLWITCMFVLSLGAHAQPDGDVLALPQQAEIAEDLLGDDVDRVFRALFVAESLGSSRMSEDVRSALISLLERMNDEQDAARSRGIPTNEVVNGEQFMSVARLVATLGDSRAIPALARVGNHGYSWPVVQGLASFGEQALPAIRDVIQAPRATDGAIGNSLVVLSMIVEDAGADALSSSAREEIVRIARGSLHNQQAGVRSMSRAIDLSMLLREPDLVQTVREFAHSPGALDARGMDRLAVDLIRTHASDAISRTASIE